MEFAILGSVEARVDGRALSLGGAKPRALLAILLLQANEPVSRDRLIDGLWGERPPPSRGHSLDDYISRLRKVLGVDRIERRAPGYVLRVEPGELDLERFELLAREGHERLAAGDVQGAAAGFRAALALWRGPALADVLFEPFATAESERLEERRLSVLEDRVEADLAGGQSSGLVAELERLAHEHPLRERLLSQLMVALYRSGQQAKALDLFQAARRRLAEELGLEPGPQLRKLERQILEQDPSLDPPEVEPAIAHLERRRSSRRSVAAALAVTVVAAAVAAGIVLDARQTTATGIAAATATRDQLVGVDVGPARIASSIGLTGAPAAIGSGNGSFWIADAGTNAVLRVDPSAGQVVDRVALPTQPGEIAVGGGAVWVASTVDGSITRIDPTTGAITQTIPLGSSPTGLTFSGGELWVAVPADQALILIDPVTGTARQTVSLTVRPSTVAAGAGVVWIASHDTGTVTEIDPLTHATIATVHVGQGPAAFAFGAGSVWVANKLDGTVSRIDPQTASVVATIPTGSGPAALAFVGGKLWVANKFSDTVSRIDPGSGAVDATVRVGGNATSLGTAGSTLWVGVSRQATHRGGKLVLLYSRHFLSIDPQVDSELPPPQYLGLAYDELVAYDHTAGPDGVQLVPDLALGLPVPTAGGRSYVFRLRPGIRYSDGRPLRASDFARAMRRLFRVGSPGLGSFTGLVGGRACALRPARCLLPHGGGRRRLDTDCHLPPRRSRPRLPLQARERVRRSRPTRHADARRRL